MKFTGSLIFALGLLGSCMYFSEARSSRRGRAIKCGETGRSKNLEMRSPTQLPEECVYNISPSSTSVCQLRVEFDLVLEQPTVETAGQAPKCNADSFTIGDLKLCGVNRNQHVYIPISVNRKNRRQTIPLTFKLESRDSRTTHASWTIQVTQLECPRGISRAVDGETELPSPINPFSVKKASNDGMLLAPTGCLQYFTEPEGSIESFNFNGGQGPYLGDLNYAICIRRPDASSNFRFTFRNFHLSSVDAAQPGYDVNCLGRQAADTAGEDYLAIPNAVTGDGSRVTRFCGNTVNGGQVTVSPVGPMVLHFHSDNSYTAPADTAREGGFNIRYRTESN